MQLHQASLASSITAFRLAKVDTCCYADPVNCLQIDPFGELPPMVSEAVLVTPEI
jgi:hypothetical protein